MKIKKKFKFREEYVIIPDLDIKNKSDVKNINYLLKNLLEILQLIQEAYKTS